MSLVRRDDQTLDAAAEQNPTGWLTVQVTQIGSGPVGTYDFSSWTHFRHWVELSDPSCGQTLEPPLALDTATLDDGTVGTPYMVTITPTGGFSPYAWVIAAGALPSGLSLQGFQDHAELVGTPTADGTAGFTLRCVDDHDQSIDVAYALTINPAA